MIASSGASSLVGRLPNVPGRDWSMPSRLFLEACLGIPTAKRTLITTVLRTCWSGFMVKEGSRTLVLQCLPGTRKPGDGAGSGCFRNTASEDVGDQTSVIGKGRGWGSPPTPSESGWRGVLSGAFVRGWYPRLLTVRPSACGGSVLANNSLGGGSGLRTHPAARAGGWAAVSPFPSTNGQSRTRTGDTQIFSLVLYQLSYLPCVAGGKFTICRR